jgi:5-methylcytosine-specific restriction endonuclease McrA
VKRYVKQNKPAPIVSRRRGLIGVSRDALRALYGDMCYLCGEEMLFHPRSHSSPDYATMEHIVPRAKGGQSTWHNVKLAHFKCNNDKRDLDLDEYLEYRSESS